MDFVKLRSGLLDACLSCIDERPLSNLMHVILPKLLPTVQSESQAGCIYVSNIVKVNATMLR